MNNIDSIYFGDYKNEARFTLKNGSTITVPISTINNFKIMSQIMELMPGFDNEKEIINVPYKTPYECQTHQEIALGSKWLFVFICDDKMIIKLEFAESCSDRCGFSSWCYDINDKKATSLLKSLNDCLVDIVIGKEEASILEEKENGQ